MLAQNVMVAGGVPFINLHDQLLLHGIIYHKGEFLVPLWAMDGTGIVASDMSMGVPKDVSNNNDGAFRDTFATGAQLWLNCSFVLPRVPSLPSTTAKIK